MVGCGQREPAYVYVPSSNYEESLTASVVDSGKEIMTNEWVSLKATRKTGPWVKMEKLKLKQDDHWLTDPPSSIEENVQANVKWNVEPKEYATFNLPQTHNLLERKVQFTKPGKYKLWATSHSWYRDPFDSNIIEINVK